MIDPATMLVHIDAAIDEGGVQSLMMSPQAFKQLKVIVPRRKYRKRTGTRFINCYRGVLIELHDEWSWGWMIGRVRESQGRLLMDGEMFL